MDVDGHRSEEPLAEALTSIEEKCSFFRVLGSYPKLPSVVRLSRSGGSGAVDRGPAHPEASKDMSGARTPD